MENQHQRIKGYRDLSQAEIDLMNKIKAHGEATDLLVREVGAHITVQVAEAAGRDDHAELERIKLTEPGRWLAMARTGLQTGIMKLVRAVAQPTTF